MLLLLVLVVVILWGAVAAWLGRRWVERQLLEPLPIGHLGRVRLLLLLSSLHKNGGR